MLFFLLFYALDSAHAARLDQPSLAALILVQTSPRLPLLLLLALLPPLLGLCYDGFVARVFEPGVIVIAVAASRSSSNRRLFPLAFGGRRGRFCDGVDGVFRRVGRFGIFVLGDAVARGCVVGGKVGIVLGRVVFIVEVGVGERGRHGRSGWRGGWC